MMFTPQDFESVGIEIPLTASGQFKTVCPRCSPTRRKSSAKCLSVNIDDGVWQCHHADCMWSGTLKRKAEPKPVRKPIPKPEGRISSECIRWFDKRGITPQTLEAEGVTSQKHFMPQINGETECIAFPYTLNGEVVNVKYRDYQKNMTMAKGCTLCLYRIDKIDPAQTIIIAEGEIDALSFIECGHLNVVSVPNGAQTARKDAILQLKYLDSDVCDIQWPEKVIIATDADGPGERLREEITRRVGPERAYYVKYPSGCKDANDVLVKFGVDCVNDLINESEAAPVQGIITALDYHDEILEEYRNISARGTSSGWDSLNENYTVSPGEVTVVTGFPGSGKSEFVDALMVNLAAMNGWRFAVFSPENQPFALHFKKLASKRIGKPFDRGPTPRISEPEIEACIDWMQGKFWFIMPDDETHDLDSIIARMRVCVHRHGVNGVVLDPWNEIDHRRPKTMNETEYISQSLTRIRRFSRLYRVHFWIVAHPVKMKRDANGEFPAPTPYDINGSANWYNKADNCITIHRDMTSNAIAVKIQKIRHRNTGAVGEVELFYDKVTGRYRGSGTAPPTYKPLVEEFADSDMENSDEIPF